MWTKSVIWKELTAEIDGHTASGSWYESSGVVTMHFDGISKAAQVGGSTRELIARVLLGELARARKAG
jgi:hypothetical protein